MALTIPTIPTLPAGAVVTAADLNNCRACVSFLLAKPMCRVQDTTGGQSIGIVTYTNVSFNVESFDTDGMFSAPDNKITVQTPGWYKIRYGVVATIGTTVLNTEVRHTTGANNPQGAGVVSAAFWGGYGIIQTTGAAGSSGLWPFYLYAGDFVQVSVIGSGTGSTTGTTNTGSFFSMEYVSI